MLDEYRKIQEELAEAEDNIGIDIIDDLREDINMRHSIGIQKLQTMGNEDL